MANGYNRQEIIGNLAADADLRMVGENSTPKLTFRVVANTGYGEYEHAEGFNVVVWGKRAEGLAPYLVKGKRVFVAGETRTGSWEDESGSKHYRSEVVASEIVLLNGGSSNPTPDTLNVTTTPDPDPDPSLIPF
jgi:single-strand DNA-binding protein